MLPGHFNTQLFFNYLDPFAYKMIFQTRTEISSLFHVENSSWPRSSLPISHPATNTSLATSPSSGSLLLLLLQRSLAFPVNHDPKAWRIRFLLLICKVNLGWMSMFYTSFSYFHVFKQVLCLLTSLLHEY